ncbi:phosphate regulon sensor histidine kinase PhoR [Pseudomonas sp. N040]|uniref:phosphate regulon sensor histidine kinase PhoR n=1 Tax=Pseudomonas sp. N040 TaxID=2785325 RepID=UPI0018A3389A|nr:phosphate regulon sensor histidine kinase PhoR [Pseudomonas sp. N040]MBF7728747.1 phosphate regulon sensor histidine kinase PhoR [Pseudomonas sp. N040]MBW7012387.1 phosphate regulon sensor histidine kinase PhoR [Pseudomonas sp. N040]
MSSERDWRGALTGRLLLLLGLCLLAGWISGQFGWAVAIGLGGYLLWLLRELLRLQRWLREAQSEDSPPPDSHGLIGEIFDSIYHLQRRNARNRERLQAVIQRIQDSTAALNDAVIMLDNRGGLEWWNPAAETLLGLQVAKDTGQPITNLVRHPGFAEYFRRGDFSEPLELTSPVNEQRRLQLQITRYGNQDHLLVVRDITRIHLLDQMRKDFVSNVSHELRTPLTVIVGYLETLLDHTDQFSPRWVRALQQMHGQAQRMQNLLNDLLLLARLESTGHPAEVQAVALEPLLQLILNDARALSAGQHTISLEVDGDARLLGSEAELHSAFSNLVFNAVKYTPAQGRIAIRWWSDALGGHLAVADSGIGIEARHLPRLAERFYRVDASRSSSTGGTGLGLAIVKHVLLRHDARLEITSRPGQGSTFICHFAPAALASSTLAPTPQRGEGQGEGVAY